MFTCLHIVHVNIYIYRHTYYMFTVCIQCICIACMYIYIYIHAVGIYAHSMYMLYIYIYICILLILLSFTVMLMLYRYLHNIDYHGQFNAVHMYLCMYIILFFVIQQNINIYHVILNHITWYSMTTCHDIMQHLLFVILHSSVLSWL